MNEVVMLMLKNVSYKCFAICLRPIVRFLITDVVPCLASVIPYSLVMYPLLLRLQ